MPGRGGRYWPTHSRRCGVLASASSLGLLAGTTARIMPCSLGADVLPRGEHPPGGPPKALPCRPCSLPRARSGRRGGPAGSRLSRLPGQPAWVVERSADRAHAWAIRAIARCDGAEQEADRGAAQVAGRQADGDLTARLAGDVDQEPGLCAVVLAQASWTGWACSPGQACRDYRQHIRVLPGEEGDWGRVLDIVRDHGSHDCRTVGRRPAAVMTTIAKILP